MYMCIVHRICFCVNKEHIVFVNQKDFVFRCTTKSTQCPPSKPPTPRKTNILSTRKKKKNSCEKQLFVSSSTFQLNKSKTNFYTNKGQRMKNYESLSNFGRINKCRMLKKNVNYKKKNVHTRQKS